jgi:hypothetical protein
VRVGDEITNEGEEGAECEKGGEDQTEIDFDGNMFTSHVSTSHSRSTHGRSTWTEIASNA